MAVPRGKTIPPVDLKQTLCESETVLAMDCKPDSK